MSLEIGHECLTESSTAAANMWKALDFVGGSESKEKCSSEIGGKMVVVAVKATREISRKAMVWALTHVVQPGDSIKLLVLIPSQSPSKKIWGFTRFTSDCSAGYHRSFSDISLDQRDDITNSCSEIMHQLYDVYDPAKIKVRLKIVPAFSCGVVAAEAKRANSNWVILDKGLKNEAKTCIDEMQCNVVVMNKSKAKVLRLNLLGPQNLDHQATYPSIEIDLYANETKLVYENMLKGPVVTPASSPDRDDSALTVTEAGTSSISSSDHGNSPSIVPENHNNTRKKNGAISGEIRQKKGRSDPDRMNFQNWIDDIHNPVEQSLFLDYKALLGQLSEFNRKSDAAMSCKLDLELSRSVREAISLSRNIPPNPRPLCSICHHKSPVFGSPPRWFSFSELETATDGFSLKNFLAEGGYGSVHRGTLVDGQVIAVKQHKLASSQGDTEFCAEVEVLSCAQHRNLVTLIGFCVEDGRRLLVYEFICNGSLDAHLYGKNCRPLDWSSRQKIALGAARGLRYLHEECRVGCIVHRDLRPNNILLTHEFEPLVGDFGLARWQPDGDLGVDTRVIGTFGYLAPEYVQSGQITEKADVYSFGIVLVELITGRKAMDIDRPKGQQCLTEWARPLLEKYAISEMIDPKLNGCYVEEEVMGMLQCASLCIRRDPSLRPRMSQVLRMLEGDSDLK